MLRQMHHGVQRQLQSGVGRDAVQNHRYRAAVGHLQGKHRGGVRKPERTFASFSLSEAFADLREVPDQSSAVHLALVEAGRHHEDGVRPGCSHLLRELDGGSGG